MTQKSTTNWKLLKGSLKWLEELGIFCSIFQRDDSQQKPLGGQFCWHMDDT